MDDLDYWRLCEELSVIQAALLAVGIDPSSETGSKCEILLPHERPNGYEAAKTAIASGLRSGKIEGRMIKLNFYDSDGNSAGIIPNSINIPESIIYVESLRAWLAKRGVKAGFFFPQIVETTDYLDRSNSRYAPKLAAAVRAWQAVKDPAGRTPKQGLMKWIREHATEYGLTDDDGKPNETGIEEIAKVANWKPEGGATKTPSG